MQPINQQQNRQGLIARLLGGEDPQQQGQAPVIRQRDPSANRNRRFAEALIQQGSSTAPVQSSGEAIARALTGVVGGYVGHKADEATQANTKLMAEILQNGGGTQELIDAGFGDTANSMLQAQATARAKNQAKLDYNKANIANKVAEFEALTPLEAQRAGAKAEATFPYKRATAAAGAAKTNINIPIDTAGSFTDKLGAGLGSGAAEQYNQLQTQIIDDTRLLPKLEAAMKIASDPSTYQGFGAEGLLAGRRVLKALGRNVDGIPDSEILQSLSQENVNAILNLAKGPQTEGDALRALKVVFGLNKDPETNQRLIQNQVNEITQRRQLYDNYTQSIQKSITANDPSALLGIAPNAINNTPAPVSALNAPVQVSSEQEALSQPVGTRFVLPDGRTGTVQP